MPLLLIRHADAGHPHDWDGPDSERPLTPHGVRQAAGLVMLLAGIKVERLLSSPYIRCRQTLAELAGVHELPVEPVDELREGRSTAAEHLVRSLLGTTSVLCSHGDVIPEVLWILHDRDGFSVAPLPMLPCSKASAWRLDDDGERFTSATYLPPPAL